MVGRGPVGPRLGGAVEAGDQGGEGQDGLLLRDPSLAGALQHDLQAPRPRLQLPSPLGERTRGVGESCQGLQYGPCLSKHGVHRRSEQRDSAHQVGL